MKYQKPEAQIVIFDNSDIITLSGGCAYKQHETVDNCKKALKVIDETLCSIFSNQISGISTNGDTFGPPNDPFGNM